jgi:hypothetical protein
MKSLELQTGTGHGANYYTPEEFIGTNPPGTYGGGPWKRPYRTVVRVNVFPSFPTVSPGECLDGAST